MPSRWSRSRLIAAAALALYLGEGSASARILISEIHHHPAAPMPVEERLEFIELYNDEPLPYDISGYWIGGGIAFEFPPETIIGGLEVVVVARDPEYLATAHGIPLPYGPFLGRLDNGGDTVFLADAGGSAVSRVEYDDRGRWPAAPDGGGPSLVLRDPLLDPGEPESWGWSPERDGTPGVVSFTVVEPEVLLNEVYRREDGSWVELLNTGSDPADISGYLLVAGLDQERMHVLAEGSVLEGRGHLLLRADDLGFAFDPLDERVLLVSPGGELVVDARRLGERSAQGSDGRHPDGAARWFRLSEATPGSSNALGARAPVVLSEIHYHPKDDERGEFLEITNTGEAPVDLAGFALTSGVRYTFPSNARPLEPGAYAVIAADPAFLESSRGLQGVYGPWEGMLRNSGERIRLRDAERRIVDEVRFYDEGSWSRWADGHGPSLELVDLRQDNSAGSAWEESVHDGSWQFFEYTAAHTAAGASELHLFLLGAGEVLVDGLELVSAVSGQSFLRDGGFEEISPYWRMSGTHSESFIEPGAGPDGSNALHVVASKRGDSRVNHIEQPLAPLSSGSYTVRLRARWLRGSAVLMTRTWGHGVPRATRLEVSPFGGTPGRPNSRARADTGPVLRELEQQPALPGAGEPVAVSVRASDPDGVAGVTLMWRIDGEESFRMAEMHRDTAGAGATGAAIDGRYRAEIVAAPPGGAVAEYFIVAADGGGLERALPAEAPERTFLYQYDDGIPAHALPAYRIVMTERDYGELLSRSPHSNHRLPASLVYRDRRILHLAGVRYKGSPVVRPHPGIGIRRAFRVRLSDEQPFRGASRLAIDESGPDPSVQVDRMVNYFLQKAAGIPYGERRYIHLIVRGQSFGVYEDALPVDRNYLERSFGEEASDGRLYKVDNHYEVDAADQYVFVKRAWTYSDDKEFLRFNFKKRSREEEDDFSDLVELLGFLDPSRTPDAEYDAGISEVLDLEQWIRALAVYRTVGDWDTIGGTTGKNVYIYHHPDGRWRVIPWDHDVALGAYPFNPSAQQSATAPLRLGRFPLVERLMARPIYERRLRREIRRLLEEDFRPEVIDPILDRTHEFLAASPASGSECPVTNPNRPCFWAPDRIKSFLRARRDYLEGVVVRQDPAEFTIDTNGGDPFTVRESPATLRGRAPISVETVLRDGAVAPVIWRNWLIWDLEVDLEPGVNEISLLAVDGRGEVVGTAMTVIDWVPERFLRGDCNDDGNVNISDPVCILGWLFLGGREPGCIAVTDADGSGGTDITDAVHLLGHLFLGGPEPRAPYPECGLSPAEDESCKAPPESCR